MALTHLVYKILNLLTNKSTMINYVLSSYKTFIFVLLQIHLLDNSKC